MNFSLHMLCMQCYCSRMPGTQTQPTLTHATPHHAVRAFTEIYQMRFSKRALAFARKATIVDPPEGPLRRHHVLRGRPFPIRERRIGASASCATQDSIKTLLARHVASLVPRGATPNRTTAQHARVALRAATAQVLLPPLLRWYSHHVLQGPSTANQASYQMMRATLALSALSTQEQARGASSHAGAAPQAHTPQERRHVTNARPCPRAATRMRLALHSTSHAKQADTAQQGQQRCGFALLVRTAA